MKGVFQGGLFCKAEAQTIELDPAVIGPAGALKETADWATALQDAGQKVARAL